MHRTSRKAVAVLVFVLSVFVSLCVLGCEKKDAALEKTLVKVAEDYTMKLAEKKFEELASMCTGDALNGLLAARPILESVDVKTVISGFEGKVDFVNDSKDRASVVCTYVQEQTVEGLGTTAQKMKTVYNMTKVGEDWKIYSASLIDASQAGSGS